MPLFNVLDWFLIGIAAFFVLRGLMRGAVSQIFGIAGILGGAWVAFRFYEAVAAQILRHFPALSAAVAGSIAFILLFILTWFCIAFIGFWVSRMLRKVGLGFLDRLWGAIIGLGKGIIFSIVAVSFVLLFTPKESPFLRESVLLPYIQQASAFLVKMAPVSVQKKYEEKRRELGEFITGAKPVFGGNPSPQNQPDPKSKGAHDGI